MAEKEKPSKNSLLSEYYVWMVKYKNHMKLLNFNELVVKQIIEQDLNITLGPSDSLYSKVCIETLPYYFRKWPTWNDACANNTRTEEYYTSLKTFLTQKLTNLKDQTYLKETYYKVVDLPQNTRGALSLCVQIPTNLTFGIQLEFKQVADNDDLLMEFKEVIPRDTNYSFDSFVNYPFLEIQFYIPGLIRFRRSMSCVWEQFIVNSDYYHQTIAQKQPFVQTYTTIDDGYSPKIYTYQILQLLFKDLQKLIITYKQITNRLAQQILYTCRTLIQDIIEANLYSNTICETIEVSFNIGKSMYGLHKRIKNMDAKTKVHKNKTLYHRKLLTPMVKYCLSYCALRQCDVNSKDIDIINLWKEENFIKNIENCLKYKCVLCNNSSTSLEEIKTHMVKRHPLGDYLFCMKCNKPFSTVDLFKNRWSHSCEANNSTAK